MTTRSMRGLLALLLAITVSCTTALPTVVPPTPTPVEFTAQPTVAITQTPEPTVIAAPTPKPTTKPPQPKHHPTVAEAKAYALAGLGPTQYECLRLIVKHEDGTWDPYRTNPVSGAYGIGQFVPPEKYAWAGSDWRWNRVTQVKGMIHYVNVRYGSACQAWSYWLAHHWY